MVLSSAPGGGDGAGNSNNNSTGAAASDEECQARRRRRPGAPGSSDDAGGPSWLRRLRPAAASPFRSSSSSSRGSADGEDDDDDPEVQEMELAPLPPPARVWPVAFGCVSMAGRMRAMEDTVSIHPALCSWVDGSPMHFFAVFDGHGGSHVSALCRERMHVFLAEELAREAPVFLRRRQEALTGGGGRPWSEAAEVAHAWRVALLRSFRHVDALAGLACACGRAARPLCRCPLSGNAPGIVGSTAVVAVLNRGRLVVANCGDSRAVLCRGPAGTPPVPLSSDHKPDRPDEMVRIEAVGGRVVFNNGARVRGILAMSRAIGDRILRPEVVCEPEVTITERTVEDQCLIIASDGMWDVINNETACNVARNCLEDGNPPPTDPAAAAAAAASFGAPAAAAAAMEPRCLRAAALLARLAIGRDTEDNISIIVVDLKHRE